MRIKWNEVTWYSKLLALIIFVALPFVGFYLGVEFEKAALSPRIMPQANREASLPPPPQPPASSAQAMHCGGFILGAQGCPAGYHCQLGRIADQGGICIHD